MLADAGLVVVGDSKVQREIVVAIGRLEEQDVPIAKADFHAEDILVERHRRAIAPDRRVPTRPQPVVIGHGPSLFQALEAPLRLDLVDARTFPSRAAIHTYRPLEENR